MNRLTWEEIKEKYPNQWIGLRDVQYKDNDGITVESAEVVYTDKTKSELGMMAIKGEDIVPRYTTPDETWQLGFIGIC